MTSQYLCVKWNNHQVNMLGVFNDLLLHENFVDVTIACDGQSIKAHKMILSSCSPFFRDLLINNPCQHPIIILNNVNFKEVKTLLEFMYKGQVQVPKERLPELFKTAEILKVKGLGEVSKAQKPLLNSDKSSGKGSSSKKSDHHYSCSTPKTLSGKRRKANPVPVDVKIFVETEHEEIVEEIDSSIKIDESQDDSTTDALLDQPTDSVLNESVDSVILDSPDVASEPALPSISTEQNELEPDSALTSAPKVTDETDNPDTENCVLTLPLVEGQESAISGLSVSELEGKQLAQVTDSSGNTILVLIPKQSASELMNPTPSETEDPVAAPQAVSKKPGKRKRTRDSKSEEPDYQEMHFKKSDGSTVKLYQCLQCDSKFANPGNVRRHTYSAHKGYRIQCEVCNTLFTQKSSKDFHFRTVHAGLRYNCDKCEAQFTEKRSLLHHIKSVHKDKDDSQ